MSKKKHKLYSNVQSIHAKPMPNNEGGLDGWSTVDNDFTDSSVKKYFLDYAISILTIC